MRRPEFLSVIVPAYNEEHRLRETLLRIAAYVEEHFATWEIIVVDDGSTDGTLDLVEELRRTLPHLSAIPLLLNQGKGRAVREGMLVADGDLRLLTDADLSTPIEEISVALRAIDGGAAIAIASRGLPTSRIERRQRRYREMMGRTFNRITRLLTGLPYLDTQCGFKLFTRAAAQTIFPKCTTERFAFDVEVLLHARHFGLKVDEFPAHWSHTHGSKVNALSDSFEMLFAILRLRLRFQRSPLTPS